jgi:uncharacterized membrane protein
MRRIWMIVFLVPLMLFGGAAGTPALAQGVQKPGDAPQGLTAPQELTIFTSYPDEVVEIGEIVTFPLTLRSTGSSPEIIRLDMQEVPKGWTTTFRGGGRIIQAVYVEPGNDASAELRLEPPQDTSPGTYRFLVVAQGEGVEAKLPIELTVTEKLPPSLKFDVNLPTLKGTPTTTFRYQATLKNEGDQDLEANLGVDAPAGFEVSIKSSAQEVTSLPLKANESKSLDIEVKLPPQTPAGQYPITVQAQGSEAQATIRLTADVTGQPELSVTAPEGRLSGQAYAGRETSLKIIVKNTGSAAARNVELSASEPNGWSVGFDPMQIAEIPANQQVEVAANIQPAEKAVAGDYMVTVSARPEDGNSESADFRITVLTSTLWGVAGVALIAVAVVVVGLAVARFGRR